MPPTSPPSIVVITRDRRERVLATLPRLLSLPCHPQVVVVDDASVDGTADAVRAAHPEVVVRSLPSSAGAAARNVGVEMADGEVVAFADDDSWWADGALSRASAAFEAHPSLGLVAARVVVEPGGREDPTNAAMATSPLAADGLPGPEVLGFIACGAVVRRSAFLEAGGFHPRFGLGAEERLLALDLRRHGFRSAYMSDVVAHHAPDAGDARPGRRQRVARNDLWTAWLRRRPAGAVRATAAALRDAASDPAARRGVAEAVVGSGWVWRHRRAVAPDVEADLRRLG